jgi:ABC-type cobalamin/Fe3+-siderophores transport system ATPase subunit
LVAVARSGAQQAAALGWISHRDAPMPPVTKVIEVCGILPSLRHADRAGLGEKRAARCSPAPFAKEPEVFLLHEPTADLDPAATHRVMHRLRETSGSTHCVVVVRAIVLALRYAHLVLLAGGRITAKLPVGEALPAAAFAFGRPFGFDPEPRLLSNA